MPFENPDRRIIYMPTEQIQPAPWNPARRTSPANLSSIVQSMKDHGFVWWKPLSIGRGDVLGDGHRRLAAARAVRIPQVPVLRIDMAADAIWAFENGRRRTATSAESLEAAVNGLTVIPEQHAKGVNEMLAVVGMEKLKESYMVGVSPSILFYARKLATYVGYDGDVQMISSIVLWLRKHEMQRRIRAALDVEVNPADILGCILTDKPLPRLQLALAKE